MKKRELIQCDNCDRPVPRKLHELLEGLCHVCKPDREDLEVLADGQANSGTEPGTIEK
jgi:hypothetical protein